MISKEAAQQLRRRFERFAQLRAEYGTQKALEMMRRNLSDVQKKLMEPYISGVSLAEGFRRSIPLFEEFGMKMEVVDISNQDKDAVLEIQRVCPYSSLAAEFGLETPLSDYLRLGSRGNPTGISRDERLYPKQAGRW